MYPHFIEVTIKEEHEEWKRLVNVDQIVFLEDHIVWVTHSDCDENPGMITVEETYDELTELIRSAGCHIEKEDPRLDSVKPLTMEELRQMYGEPVWNSNTRRWYLVMDDPDEVTVCIMDNKDNVEVYNEDKLTANPLYRMKEG